jgi:hypothetical protein
LIDASKSLQAPLLIRSRLFPNVILNASLGASKPLNDPRNPPQKSFPQLLKFSGTDFGANSPGHGLRLPRIPNFRLAIRSVTLAPVLVIQCTKAILSHACHFRRSTVLMPKVGFLFSVKSCVQY